MADPPPARFCCVRLDWDRTAIALPALAHFRTVHIGPEPGHPFGRKGAMLAGAWTQLADHGTDGMLILDGDVGVDPLDITAMRAAIARAPHQVWTAPVKLWSSTSGTAALPSGNPDWTWSHRTGAYSKVSVPDPEFFSFCFTYLPRAVVEVPGLRTWTFPRVDLECSRAARKMRIPVGVVEHCWPKHLHY
jgi:hypothetical protein